MEFDLRYSDREITAWGGMALMKRMLDHLQFDAALRASGLPASGSNRGCQAGHPLRRKNPPHPEKKPAQKSPGRSKLYTS